MSTGGCCEKEPETWLPLLASPLGGMEECVHNGAEGEAAEARVEDGSQHFIRFKEHHAVAAAQTEFLPSEFAMSPQISASWAVLTAGVGSETCDFLNGASAPVANVDSDENPSPKAGDEELPMGPIDRRGVTQSVLKALDDTVAKMEFVVTTGELVSPNPQV